MLYDNTYLMQDMEKRGYEILALLLHRKANITTTHVLQLVVSVYCIFYIVYCILYIVYCILYIVYCVLNFLFTVHCKLNILYCTNWK